MPLVTDSAVSEYWYANVSILVKVGKGTGHPTASSRGLVSVFPYKTCPFRPDGYGTNIDFWGTILLTEDGGANELLCERDIDVLVGKGEAVDILCEENGFLRRILIYLFLRRILIYSFLRRILI